MGFALSALSNSPSITHLASSQSPNQPTSFSDEPELKRKGLASLVARRPLTFVDLAEPGAMARASADSRLFAGDYDIAQLWSRAFYEYPLVRLDGILYPARHDQTRVSIAVLDRAEGIELLDRQSWYEDEGEEGKSLRSKLGEILDHNGFRLIGTVARPQKKGPGRSAQASFAFD